MSAPELSPAERAEVDRFGIHDEIDPELFSEDWFRAQLGLRVTE